LTAPFLHLTNGSAIIPLMREAQIVGRIVPWDDVLHEGPVPAGLNVAALGDTRAGFLASCGWGSRDGIRRSLAERDAALEAASGGAATRAGYVDEIVLWFEHDLYDQLQILQILDRLPLDGGPRLTAVPGDDYLVMPGLKPGRSERVEPGRAFSPGAHVRQLFATRRDVTSSQRIAARDAWDAFRSEDPRAIVHVLERVTDLPHLPAALRRHLQQFPAVRNGLSRTEQQTLEAVARGLSLARDVFFQANHQSEEAVFMGDAAFLFHIRGLVQGQRPLLDRAVKAVPAGESRAPRSSAHALSLDTEFTITDDGRRVLAGDADRIALCGIDRWLGGVHLRGQGPVWRWNDRTGVLHERS
jgi:hypothetical protein